MLSVKKALFRNYGVKSFNLDGFCMESLKDSIYYKSFANVLKIVLTLSHDQPDVEHGFSLNNELSCWKHEQTNLIGQRFVKDHMLLAKQIWFPMVFKRSHAVKWLSST